MSGQNSSEPGDRETVSVIGPGIEIKGNIESSGNVQIECRVYGDVRCATLILPEAGMIAGSIQADRVRVSGAVEGSIDACDVAIEATAKISGDITYARLKMSSGGVVEGRLAHRAATEAATENGNLKLVEARPQPQPQPKPRAVYVD